MDIKYVSMRDRYIKYNHARKYKMDIIPNGTDRQSGRDSRLEIQRFSFGKPLVPLQFVYNTFYRS